jgi:hypothetical protein
MFFQVDWIEEEESLQRRKISKILLYPFENFIQLFWYFSGKARVREFFWFLNPFSNFFHTDKIFSSINT